VLAFPSFTVIATLSPSASVVPGNVYDPLLPAFTVWSTSDPENVGAVLDETTNEAAEITSFHVIYADVAEASFRVPSNFILYVPIFELSVVYNVYVCEVAENVRNEGRAEPELCVDV
jgi:hypothetical protein